MGSALLTIVIPTYNRARNLSLLLATLKVQLNGIEEKVIVVVGDNASTDETPIVTDHFLSTMSETHILRHTSNLGPDENFCRCIEQVKTRYFWMLGDDDLPKVGVVKQLVDLITSEDFDLLYLNSEWVPNIQSPADGIAIAALNPIALSRTDFSHQVNVWFTFISGMVVNRQRLFELNPNLDLRRFSGTSLVQLGWILPLLMCGDKFQIINQRCILATSGNTGGYRALTVFGTNYPAILDAVCGPDSQERHLIVKSLAWTFMPALLRMTRFKNSGNFVEENTLEALAPLQSSLAYWVILLPMATLPKFLAMPVYVVFRLFKLIVDSGSTLKKMMWP
jgi:abequosyltransferase